METLSFNTQDTDFKKLCPFCGSVSISRKSRTHKQNRKSPLYSEGAARNYTCRKCGEVFSNPISGLPKYTITKPRMPDYLFRGV